MAAFVEVQVRLMTGMANVAELRRSGDHLVLEVKNVNDVVVLLVTDAPAVHLLTLERRQALELASLLQTIWNAHTST